MISLERVVDAQLVVRGDALGDRDHQLHARGGGFEDRVGGKARRYEDHRGVRLRLGHRLLPAVEHGDALHVLTALARRHPTDDVCAVAAVVQRVERTLFAGNPGDCQARALVDQDGHQALAPTLVPAANATTISAASFIVLRRVHIRQRGLLQQTATLDVVGPVQTYHKRHRWFYVLERGDQPPCDLVAARDAAEDVEQDGLDGVVGEQQIDRLLDLLGVRAAAGVEEVRGRAARLGDDVQRRHHQARAVAEDADVAVELDVLDALFLGSTLDRVFVLAVGRAPGSRGGDRARCRRASPWRRAP